MITVGKGWRRYQALAGAALATAGPLSAQTSTAAASIMTAFVDVAVIPMDRERVVDHQTVVVRGNTIVALGPVDKVMVPAGAERIDGQGKFLIPGLGDMHTHVAKPSSGNYFHPIDTLLPLAEVQRELWPYLANGVTTIRNASGNPQALSARALVAEGKVVGPRILTAGPPLRYPDTIAGGVTLDTLGNLVTREQLRDIADTMHDRLVSAAVMGHRAAEEVRRQKAAGHDFLKQYAIYSQEVFDSFVTAAREVGMPIMGHLQGRHDDPANLPRALAVPYSSIEHLEGYLAYISNLPSWDSTRFGALFTNNSRLKGQYLPHQGKMVAHFDPQRLQKAAAMTARAGVWNSPHPGLGGGPYSDTKYRIVKALQDAGAGLLVGSEGGGRKEIHGALQNMVKAGLTPYQALATGTRNVAVYLREVGLAATPESGTIAVGKRADLVLLGANPLVDIKHTSEIAGVMLAGRWLPRDTLDAHVRRP